MKPDGYDERMRAMAEDLAAYTGNSVGFELKRLRECWTPLARACGQVHTRPQPTTLPVPLQVNAIDGVRWE